MVVAKDESCANGMCRHAICAHDSMSSSQRARSCCLIVNRSPLNRCFFAYHPHCNLAPPTSRNRQHPARSCHRIPAQPLRLCPQLRGPCGSSLTYCGGVARSMHMRRSGLLAGTPIWHKCARKRNDPEDLHDLLLLPLLSRPHAKRLRNTTLQGVIQRSYNAYAVRVQDSELAALGEGVEGEARCDGAGWLANSSCTERPKQILTEQNVWGDPRRCGFYGPSSRQANVFSDRMSSTWF